MHNGVQEGAASDGEGEGGDVGRIDNGTDLLLGEPEVQTLAILAKELQTVAEEEDVSSSRTQSETEETPLDSHGPRVLEPPPSSVLDVDDFDNGPPEFGPSRLISSLAGRPVLIEWTHYSTSIN